MKEVYKGMLMSVPEVQRKCVAGVGRPLMALTRITLSPSNTSARESKSNQD
jgi:hypothetical protein